LSELKTYHESGIIRAITAKLSYVYVNKKTVTPELRVYMCKGQMTQIVLVATWL